MSKRRLNKQQLSRIQRRQHSRSLKSQKPLEDNVDPSLLLGPEEGIVIARFGTQADVLPVDQERSIQRCHLRANVQSVVAGDKVIWQASKEALGVIESILPRSTELTRPDNRGHTKTLAANITQMVIVTALEPTPINHLIDRYLVAAHQQELRPLIVINKIDLLDSKNLYSEESLKVFLKPYQDIGYDIVQVSSQNPETLKNLSLCLNKHFSIFTGQSGVGKSSLINALLPNIDAMVGEVSEATGKGKHTTTTARLYPIPNGDGAVIDSPGIREMGLWIKPEERLESYFPDINKFASQCRFRNCQHEDDPGCAVQKALLEDDIHPERFRSFQRMRDNLVSKTSKEK